MYTIRSWNWLALLGWVMVMSASLSAARAQTAPLLPEPGEDRWQFDAGRWEKALTLEGFTLPTDREEDTRGLLASTAVKVHHDGTHLHLLFDAADPDPSKIKADAFDEFADMFPQGDHGQVTVGTRHVFAFGPQGNKYDAMNFDREYFSGFQVRSRVTDKGWQSIVIIPIRALPRDRDGSMRLTFVRHFDHGLDQPQRSYLAVRKLTLAAE